MKRTKITSEQARRISKSLQQDVAFEDWLKHSPPMGALRNTAGLIGECVQNLSIAVKRRDWALVEVATCRLSGYATALTILADAGQERGDK